LRILGLGRVIGEKRVYVINISCFCGVDGSIKDVEEVIGARSYSVAMYKGRRNRMETGLKRIKGGMKGYLI
jgi:hypothetical protein